MATRIYVFGQDEPTPVVITEPLSTDEEANFIDALAESADCGFLTQEEALRLIDREYELLTTQVVA